MLSTDFLEKNGIINLETTKIAFNKDSIHFVAMWKDEEGEVVRNSISIFFDEGKSFINIYAVERRRGCEDFPRMYLPEILVIASPGLFRVICDTLKATDDHRAHSVLSLMLKEAQVP